MVAFVSSFVLADMMFWAEFINEIHLWSLYLMLFYINISLSLSLFYSDIQNRWMDGWIDDDYSYVDDDDLMRIHVIVAVGNVK